MPFAFRYVVGTKSNGWVSVPAQLAWAGLPMRTTDPDPAGPEALSNEGWLTVLDGPLYRSRHRRGLPVIGYVKKHHRCMLAREHWVRVPELTAGERSGLFAMEDALYGCYLRVGDPKPWAGPWAGIARLEMPSGIGRAAAVEAADQAAGWLPRFASALHPGMRVPLHRNTQLPTKRRGGWSSPTACTASTSRLRAPAATIVASPALLTPDCRTPEQMRLANPFCRFLELAPPAPAHAP